MHLHNFDIIRILIPQLTEGEHHAGEDGLYRILILALGGKGQGDTGFFFIHLGFHTVAQHIRDGALGKLHGGGDGSTDNVRPSLAIAAVTRDGEPGDSPVLIEKFNSSHYTEIFSICTLV